MNRVTIINGFKGEGKTEELIEDFLGHIKDDEVMTHCFATTMDEQVTIALIKHMVEGMRKDNPEFAKGAKLKIYHMKTFADLEWVAKDNNDSSAVLYIDGTEYLDKFNMDGFLELVDEYQFDCYITRQRCIKDRVLN